MKDFKNKVVIVTGASSGIGEAMAREFAAQGARVVLGARSVQKLQLIAGDIRSRGGQAAYCGVDVTDVGECRELIDTAVREFGGIDVLVCNAGLSMRAIFDDVDLEVLHRLMDVNFWGTVNCCKFALPYLQQSHGSIVGISSVAGLHGLPGRTGYSASKYAMTGFLETLRIENLKKGLHVMIACPGFTASNVRFSALTADGTQQGATPRDEAKMMTPEEVARIVARGIQKRKRLCLMENEGRATHFVKKFAPGFLDRMFYLVMSREPDSPGRAPGSGLNQGNYGTGRKTLRRRGQARLRQDPPSGRFGKRPLATQGGVWQLGAHVRRAGRRPLRRRRLEMVVALLFRCAGHAGHQRPSRGAG